MEIRFENDLAFISGDFNGERRTIAMSKLEYCDLYRAMQISDKTSAVTKYLEEIQDDDKTDPFFERPVTEILEDKELIAEVVNDIVFDDLCRNLDDLMYDAIYDAALDKYGPGIRSVAEGVMD